MEQKTYQITGEEVKGFYNQVDYCIGTGLDSQVEKGSSFVLRFPIVTKRIL